MSAVVVADEPERFVVRVLFLTTKIPPDYAHYVVSKATGETAVLDDDEPYRPKAWR